MNFYCCFFVPVFFRDADFRMIHLPQKGGALVAPPGKPSYGGRKPRWRTSWECFLQALVFHAVLIKLSKARVSSETNLKMKAEDHEMLTLERSFTSSRKKLTEVYRASAGLCPLPFARSCERSSQCRGLAVQ